MSSKLEQLRAMSIVVADTGGIGYRAPRAALGEVDEEGELHVDGPDRRERLALERTGAAVGVDPRHGTEPIVAVDEDFVVDLYWSISRRSTCLTAAR